jgi:hypothetical protein
MIGDLNINYNMEEWKQIPDYEMYEVSNLGQVRRWNKAGTKFKEITPKAWGNNPYLMFTVCKHRKPTKIYFHRILAQLFLPNDNPKEFTDVCFKDNVCTNTDLSNLYWSNQDLRMKRRKAEGKYENISYNAKLSEDQVREIRSRWTNRSWSPCPTQGKLAQEYGVHHWTIHACIKRITWKSIQ